MRSRAFPATVFEGATAIPLDPPGSFNGQNPNSQGRAQAAAFERASIEHGLVGYIHGHQTFPQMIYFIQVLEGNRIPGNGAGGLL